MTTWHAFLLGLIQGITEFLPISSSGHLALTQYFFGFEHLQNYVLFDLICHLGTLGSICCIFFRLIKDNLTTQKTRLGQIALATLPLFPLVLILKPLKAIFNQPQLLGPGFVITACLLFAGLRWRIPFAQTKLRKWQDPLTIGLFQAVAILPGISRSGATISAARLLGWSKETAIQFSFLLAIPAILGATILEIWHGLQNPELMASIDFFTFFVGFLTSFVTGCFSLWVLMRMLVQDKWHYFAWYCLLLGISSTIYFNGLV